MECVAALMQQRRDLDERLPLHEQHHVQAAMHSFRAEMSSVSDTHLLHLHGNISWDEHQLQDIRMPAMHS